LDDEDIGGGYIVFDVRRRQREPVGQSQRVKGVRPVKGSKGSDRSFVQENA
jgi:hypothetical protein